MLKRTITGAIIFLITLAFIFLKQVHALFFDAYVLIFSYGALYEMISINKLSNKKIDTHLIWLVPALVCLVLNLEKDYFKAIVWLLLIAVAYFVIMITSEIIELAKKRKNGTTEKNISVLNQTLFEKTKNSFMVLAYPVLVLSFMMGLNHLPYVQGYIGIILVFAVSMLTDTMAYFVGFLWGKTKFVPEVSPKKTIAGMIGGFAGGVLASTAVFLLFYFTDFLALSSVASLGTLITMFVVVGLLGSFITQLGDLVESAFKRRVNIKDSSNIFPGHGGFLDRVDGLMFNSALIYVLFVLFLV